jgi:hypothetical protein
MTLKEAAAVMAMEAMGWRATPYTPSAYQPERWRRIIDRLQGSGVHSDRDPLDAEIGSLLVEAEFGLQKLQERGVLTLEEPVDATP